MRIHPCVANGQSSPLRGRKALFHHPEEVQRQVASHPRATQPHPHVRRPRHRITRNDRGPVQPVAIRREGDLLQRDQLAAIDRDAGREVHPAQ